MAKNILVRKNEKSVYILLTRYPDKFSGAFRLATGACFSHASIGLDGPGGKFYSFVTKGFRIENPRLHPKFQNKAIPCRLYQLKVSEEVHEKIGDILNHYVAQSEKYRYSYIGLVLSILKIPLKPRRRYFCSQFVSEVLVNTDALLLQKHSALYLPDDFVSVEPLTLCFKGMLHELVATSRFLQPAYTI